jgi:hypothetical protein
MRYPNKRKGQIDLQNEREQTTMKIIKFDLLTISVNGVCGCDSEGFARDPIISITSTNISDTKIIYTND